MQAQPYPVIVFDPVPVEKNISTPIFAHYMPWFETPAFEEFGNANFGDWGLHWTMATKNPDEFTPEGKRVIASHYTPLIDAYDNGEPHYLEYAVVCMKLSGLDGVFIDYLSNTDLYDWPLLHDHTKALIPWLKKAGLKYAIVYEDSAAKKAHEKGLGNIKDLAIEHFQYMHEHFFEDDNYVHHNGLPLLLVFGPQSGMSQTEWMEVLDSSAHLVTLNYFIASNGLEEVAAGEYAWAASDAGLAHFYRQCTDKYDICIGSAMPGYEDYYVEGGWKDAPLNYIDPKDGQRLRDVLEIAAQYELDYLQLPTWNDWGEGTIIEPACEFGYDRLNAIQDFLGVEYGEADLSLAVKLYQKRKSYIGNMLAMQILDQVFYFLVSLQLEQARNLLNQLDVLVSTQTIPTIDDIQLYPNPSKDVLQVNGAEGNRFTIEDGFGKRYLNGRIHSQGIDISRLSSGIYTIRVQMKDRQWSNTFVKF